VVQEHDARRHHFDFRLEIGDVLASWVVPRGPASESGDRRLALRMEDHPLEYVDFEGEIPEGEYGAGKVKTWDIGAFENITTAGNQSVPATSALDEGYLVVRLKGKKLHGCYALQRTEVSDNEERWLLIRTRDEGDSKAIAARHAGGLREDAG